MITMLFPIKIGDDYTFTKDQFHPDRFYPIWEYDYEKKTWFYSPWNKIQLVEHAENGEDLYD